MIAFASNVALASDKEEAIKLWKSADDAIQIAMDTGKKSDLDLPSYDEKFGFGGNTLVCYDVTGKQISKEECDSARSFVLSLNGRKIESIKELWQKDKCRTSLDTSGFCKQDYQNLKKSNQQLKHLLDENKEVALKLIPTSFQNYQSRVSENLTQLATIERQLENPQEVRKMVKGKLQSKECKIYHVTADICRKSHVEAAANNGLAMEDEATKQSGMVNRYSRYKLGQMKAMHGTSDLPKLKNQYRQLVGSDWTPKTCEASPEVKRKLATGEMTDESEEIEACGCAGLDCQEI